MDKALRAIGISCDFAWESCGEGRPGFARGNKGTAADVFKALRTQAGRPGETVIPHSVDALKPVTMRSLTEMAGASPVSLLGLSPDINLMEPLLNLPMTAFEDFFACTFEDIRLAIGRTADISCTIGAGSWLAHGNYGAPGK